MKGRVRKSLFFHRNFYSAEKIRRRHWPLSTVCCDRHGRFFQKLMVFWPQRTQTTTMRDGDRFENGASPAWRLYYRAKTIQPLHDRLHNARPLVFTAFYVLYAYYYHIFISQLVLCFYICAQFLTSAKIAHLRLIIELDCCRCLFMLIYL